MLISSTASDMCADVMQIPYFVKVEEIQAAVGMLGGGDRLVLLPLNVKADVRSVCVAFPSYLMLSYQVLGVAIAVVV